MSKRDILTVCTLAAHLAAIEMFRAIEQPTEHLPADVPAGKIAADAMKLQRLGRRARNNATKACNIPGWSAEPHDGKLCRHDEERMRIEARVCEILGPYGLTCKVGGDPRGFCLHILGLPGNTLGGDESGYGI